MGVCEADSQPQHQVSDRLSSANALQLTVELFSQVLRIALVVLLCILVLDNFDHIHYGRPIKHLHK